MFVRAGDCIPDLFQTWTATMPFCHAEIIQRHGWHMRSIPTVEGTHQPVFLKSLSKAMLNWNHYDSYESMKVCPLRKPCLEFGWDECSNWTLTSNCNVQLDCSNYFRERCPIGLIDLAERHLMAAPVGAALLAHASELEKFRRFHLLRLL